MDILFVAKYDDGIHLLKCFLLFASGDGNVSRKFELDDGESEEADSEVHFKFGRQSGMASAASLARLSRQTTQQRKTQRRLHSQASHGVAYTAKKIKGVAYKSRASEGTQNKKNNNVMHTKLFWW